MLEENVRIIYEFIISLWGMSFQASIVIGVVLCLRLLFQKLNISKKYVMLLWIIPFVCLIFPWKISSPIGFWNNAPSEYENVIKEAAGAESRLDVMLPQSGTANMSGNQVSDNDASVDKQSNLDKQDSVGYQDGSGKFENGINQENGVNVNASVGVIDEGNSGISSDANSDSNISSNASFADDTNIQVDANFDKESIVLSFATLWGIGVLVLGVYSIVSYGRLKQQLCKRIQIRDRVYFVDDIPVPMVVGVFNSKIYVPTGIEKEHLEYVVAHEETHIKRKDTVTKVLGYFITCLHWFNPLVWLAYILMVKDMEMTCDEETILRLGECKKKEYATALLQLATGKRNVFAVPLAFGEGNTKGRIMNILKYKRTKTILSVAALVLCVLLAVLFLTKGEGKLAGNTNGTEAAEDEQAKTLRLSMKDIYEALLAGTVEELNYREYINEEESIDLVTENYEIPITYNDESFVLLASYKKDAKLPKKVELENKYGERHSLYNEKNDTEESLFWTLQIQDNFCSFIGMERNIVQEKWEAEIGSSLLRPMCLWIKHVFTTESTDYSMWYEKYNGETLHRIVTDDGSASPALCGDIVYYQSGESDIQAILKTMIDSMMQPLMTPSDRRPYTITRYLLEEQPVVKVNENVWIVNYLNGYYEYDGKDMIDFETAREWEYSYAPREDGLISFFRQGGPGVFTYILLKDKDVYRLQKASDMVGFYDDYMQGKINTLDGLDIADEELTHMQKVLLNREGFYGKLPFYEDKPKDWYMVEDCVGFGDYSNDTENSFCIVDMDHDGEEEVCVSFGGYVMFLRSQDDGIHGYHFAKSKVDEIYKDGTFINSYNSFFYGNASFVHNTLTYEVITSKITDLDRDTYYYKYDEGDSSQMGGIKITEEEYNEIMSNYELEEAEWYPLTVENILKYVP